MIKIERWVQQKQKDKGFSLVKSLLYLLSLIFQSVVRLRHICYAAGLFSVKKAEVPVISVGNIVCGGTGKSEFVSKLLRDLGRDDLAILSRGYRSKRTGGSRIVKDEKDGDEPFMLQSRFKNIPVIVGKKREVSAEFAKELGAKAVLLDDGMQYLRLQKDIQIVMVRADEPFGGGFLPFGMRRELLEKLKKATYVVIHGAECKEKYELVKTEVLCYTRSKCFGTRYCLKKDKEIFRKKVGVFCGVGNPQAFMKALEDLELTPVYIKILPDHGQLDCFDDFYSECKRKGADAVVCTEKDYVKLTRDAQRLVHPIQISMEISYDSDVYHTLIEHVNNIIDTNDRLTKDRI